MTRSLYVFLGIVCLLFLIATGIRHLLGIDFTLESLRVYISSLGWAGLLVFFLLVVFRRFLFLPTWLILPVGGWIFGVTLGMLVGAAGIILFACTEFLLVRHLALGWAQNRMHPRMKALLTKGENFILLAVAGTTAHPVGPMSLAHLGAGLSSVNFLAFLAVLGISAMIRAFILCNFGASLWEPGSWGFIIATLLLITVLVTPFFFKNVQAVLREIASSAEKPSTEKQ